MAQAYTLGSIKEIADNIFGGRTRYGFDIIGVIGKPLVTSTTRRGGRLKRPGRRWPISWPLRC
jgi:hypothetical protein